MTDDDRRTGSMAPPSLSTSLAPAATDVLQLVGAAGGGARILATCTAYESVALQYS